MINQEQDWVIHAHKYLNPIQHFSAELFLSVSPASEQMGSYFNQSSCVGRKCIFSPCTHFVPGCSCYILQVCYSLLPCFPPVKSPGSPCLSAHTCSHSANHPALSHAPHLFVIHNQPQTVYTCVPGFLLVLILFRFPLTFSCFPSFCCAVPIGVCEVCDCTCFSLLPHSLS